MKLPCAVTRDLLPLYAENMVEQETKILIEEHLSECDDCRKKLSEMKTPTENPTIAWQMLLERQKEGIAIAKREGKYKGRQPAKVEKWLFEQTYENYINRKINKNDFADEIGVTWPTMNKMLKAYQDGSIIEKNGYYYVDNNKK